MYVRLVRFALEPGQRTAAQALADDLGPLISGQPGCKGITVFGDDTDGQWGMVVYWDSQENANNAARLVRPQLDLHLAGRALGPPETHLFEVISD